MHHARGARRGERGVESGAGKVAMAETIEQGEARRLIVKGLGRQFQRVGADARTQNDRRFIQNDGLYRRVGFSHDRRQVVGAVDRDGDGRGIGAAVMIVQRDRRRHCRLFADAEEIQCAVADLIGPAERAVVGIDRMGQRERLFKRLNFARRQRGCAIGQRDGLRDRRRRPVGQIDVGEMQRPACRR